LLPQGFEAFSNIPVSEEQLWERDWPEDLCPLRAPVGASLLAMRQISHIDDG